MSFLSDLRFAVRSLRRQPFFALTVVATLAVATYPHHQHRR